MPKHLGRTKKLQRLPLGAVAALVIISALNLVSSPWNTLKYSIMESMDQQVLRVLPSHKKKHDLYDYDYSCYPSRNQLSDEDPSTASIISNPIVYLDTVWFNLHSETFYTYIHKICSCEGNNKDPMWTITNNTQSVIPYFYIGPANFIQDDFRRILTEYNTTTCGPIFIGEPPETGESYYCHDNVWRSFQT